MDADRGCVVVTGGCGFIGSHLVRRLAAEGRQVRVVDDLSNGDAARLPSGVELRFGDVADPALLREVLQGAAAVYHLAAVASVARANERWLASHLTNSAGTVAVLEAIRDVAPNVPLVYASSAAVYGDAGPRQSPIDETVSPRPLGPYGADKLAGEVQARVGGALFGVRSCGLRFFNVYGLGQAPESPYTGVITRFIAQARAGGPITIHGDGAQTRDFVHVDDVVDALVAAAAVASAEAPVVNVCSGRATSVTQLAETIAGLVTPPAPTVHDAPRPGDIRHSVGDPAAAERLLGWRARVRLEHGLAALLAAEPGVALA